MKISGRSELPAIVFPKALRAAPDTDLLTKRKPSRRKSRGHGFPAAGIRVKRDGAPAGRSRPETPLLKWKFHDGDKGAPSKEVQPSPEFSRKSFRTVRRGPDAAVSVRRLAGGLWRLRSMEAAAGDGGGARRWEGEERLGFQPGVGLMDGSFISHCNCQSYTSESKERMPSSHSFSGPKNRFGLKHGQSFRIPNSAMEGATKWDPVQSKTPDDLHMFCARMKLLNKQVSAVSVVSAMKSELEQAHARIQELEMERRSSKKKLEHFLRNLNEEKALWRTREHEKIRAVIDDVKAELSWERKNRQRMELVNSKLVGELAEVKFSAKRVMQDHEKERRTRELIEEVCNELVKEIGKDKAEIESAKRESMKLREEIDDERKMLQMAEVWREECVHMKLVDAKVALDEKYTQMSELVAEMKHFLRSRNAAEEEMQEAAFLLQAAALVNIQEVKDFVYEPPKPGDIFSVLEDVERNGGVDRSPASHASRIHTVSPDVNPVKEDDESGWETMSQPEPEGSSYSPEGSELSFNNGCFSGSATEWEGEEKEKPVSSASSLHHAKQLKRLGLSRFWRSCPGNGESYKIVSLDGVRGRLSDGSNVSLDEGLGRSGRSPSDGAGQWSSPDSGNAGAGWARGCMEWPRSMQKGSLKGRLLEVKLDGQKIQLRHVLKQRI